MMSSLFEVYDPYTFFMNLSLNWFLIFFSIIGLFTNFQILLCSNFFILIKILMFLMNEFEDLFSKNKMKKSSVMFFVFLFIYILLINLLGLLPYVFSCSSQFVLALSLGFPFWLGLVIMGCFAFTNEFFIHLIPLGTPMLLIPLMVLIETISTIIRPWSLSIRLVANMISGHLLMSLLGNCGLILFFIQIFFFFFEFFVCFIQAYVFSVLLTLYSSEI